jgi:hypothetical protein
MASVAMRGGGRQVRGALLVRLNEAESPLLLECEGHSRSHGCTSMIADRMGTTPGAVGRGQVRTDPREVVESRSTLAWVARWA